MRIQSAVEKATYLHIQAAFQKYTDNAVSKTINLPSDANVEDIRRIYLLAYKLKCKGITVYSYGCKDEQVLSFDYNGKVEPGVSGQLITAEPEYSGGCVTVTCVF